MRCREAKLTDIPQLQIIRHSVKENILSDPTLVTDELCALYLTERGKGWVCEVDGKVVGFSIVDMQEHNVWALFLLPEFESQGIGKQLHNMLLNWYFEQTRETIWLGTDPGTRAEQFYRRQGWREIGTHGRSEIKFEMRYEDWKACSE
ncbi:GNAT family N-acetyltransferase [Pontibacter ramchanderi]|uniref:Acetyltransferase (GNAT) family protein n=1 Tax=Pontibacter ramchanderi TaxID=1179743 RepID=A0A2N3U895_9BACT|nr:GNAT family N-acetyltransferase [Pontibacter ramchanderi]PKV62973.1 acetyltransferase (GNAT) family protein [Pontibacter ramchanderi]